MKTLAQIVAQNRREASGGIASWCTAHPETLQAILQAHHRSDDAILIEATCNQVNQYGGYTGMDPAAFRRFAEKLAGQANVDPSRIIFGGDHLGPNPWRDRQAAEAMAEASRMVRAFAEAGFTKFHLDASMACADDGRLDESVIAERAAELCAVADAHSGSIRPVYVIGTEVPIPGGEVRVLDELEVSSPEAVHRTYQLHRGAFAKRGLQDAFARVVGLVVQPGVDFGNSQIFAFDKPRARALSQSVAQFPGVVFEAHSTDYQSERALSELVQSHFAILKVGPELTFAYREALFAMEGIEARLMVPTPSRLQETIESVMDDDPRHWREHVARDENENTNKIFGLSDRIRYYWPNARIAEAVAQLRRNIDSSNVPIGLASQFSGQLAEDESGLLSERIIKQKVGSVVEKYRSACRTS